MTLYYINFKLNFFITMQSFSVLISIKLKTLFKSCNNVIFIKDWGLFMTSSDEIRKAIVINLIVKLAHSTFFEKYYGKAI